MNNLLDLLLTGLISIEEYAGSVEAQDVIDIYNFAVKEGLHEKVIAKFIQYDFIIED